MLRMADVSARIVSTGGTHVAFSDTLEVSLDCCICHRCHRTVIFEVGGVEGRCTPIGHPFPGKVVSKAADGDSVVYRLEYWYEPFTDAKYPEVRQSNPLPTWGRVGFTVACPECNQTQNCSVQTNTVRPVTCHCKCGRVLYTEVEEMPVMSPAERGT